MLPIEPIYVFIFRFTYTPSPLFASYHPQTQFVQYATAAPAVVDAEIVDVEDDNVVVEADSSAPVVTGKIDLRNIIPIFESDLRSNDILFVKPESSEAADAAADGVAGGAVIVPEFRSLN